VILLLQTNRKFCHGILPLTKYLITSSLLFTSVRKVAVILTILMFYNNYYYYFHTVKEAIMPSIESMKNISLNCNYDKNDSTEFTTIHTHYYEFYDSSKKFISLIKNGKIFERNDTDDNNITSSISSDMNIHITVSGTFYLIGMFSLLLLIHFLLLTINNVIISYIIMLCRICGYCYIQQIKKVIVVETFDIFTYKNIL